MVFSLIDMRHKPTKDDIDMLDFLLQTGLNFTVVLTKSDKLNKSERESQLQLIKTELSFLPENVKIIPFSSLNGEGVDSVKEIIESTVDV